MTDIQVFAFEAEEVRIHTKTEEGVETAWFVGIDICKVLGIKNHRDALSRLEEDEIDVVGITDAVGRSQDTLVVNESGVYALVLRSRKPQAKRFRKWITSEVIPSIRRKGSYSVDQTPVPQAQATGLVSFEDMMIAQLQEQKKIKEDMAAQKAQIAEQEQRIANAEQHIFAIADNLTKSPERAQLRRAVNEYCSLNNVTQDMAWSVLTGKLLDKFSIDIVRRVANKRATIQTQRVAEGKRPYAASTLKTKFTAVDAIFEARLEHEAMKILAGLLAS